MNVSVFEASLGSKGVYCGDVWMIGIVRPIIGLSPISSPEQCLVGAIYTTALSRACWL
jgi:hypothetical protein